MHGLIDVMVLVVMEWDFHVLTITIQHLINLEDIFMISHLHTIPLKYLPMADKFLFGSKRSHFNSSGVEYCHHATPREQSIPWLVHENSVQQ